MRSFGFLAAACLLLSHAGLVSAVCPANPADCTSTLALQQGSFTHNFLESSTYHDSRYPAREWSVFGDGSLANPLGAVVKTTASSTLFAYKTYVIVSSGPGSVTCSRYTNDKSNVNGPFDRYVTPLTSLDVAVPASPVNTISLNGAAATSSIWPYKVDCWVVNGGIAVSPRLTFYLAIKAVQYLPTISARVSWVHQTALGQLSVQVPFFSTLEIVASSQYRSVAKYPDHVGDALVSAAVNVDGRVADIGLVVACDNGYSDRTNWPLGRDVNGNFVPNTFLFSCYYFDVDYDMAAVAFTIVVEPYKANNITDTQFIPPSIASNRVDKTSPLIYSSNAIISSILTSSGKDGNLGRPHVYVGETPGFVNPVAGCPKSGSSVGVTISDIGSQAAGLSHFSDLYNSLFASDDRPGVSDITCYVSADDENGILQYWTVNLNTICLYPGMYEFTCSVFDVAGNSDDVHYGVIIETGKTVITPPCTQSGTCGDPQFTGFLGQSYQIHGVSGQSYSILSTSKFQYNALFTYLNAGKCRQGTMCFSHPGNYFGEVGVLLRDLHGVVSKVQVIAGPVDQGLRVLVNGEQMNVTAVPINIGESTLFLGSSFDFLIHSPEFSMKLSNSDMFINQDVSINTELLSRIQQFKQLSKSGNVASATTLAGSLPHGLLGQTWQYKTYDNRWKYIQGTLFEYSLSDGVMGTDFKYNRF